MHAQTTTHQFFLEKTHLSGRRAGDRGAGPDGADGGTRATRGLATPTTSAKFILLHSLGIKNKNPTEQISERKISSAQHKSTTLLVADDSSFCFD